MHFKTEKAYVRGLVGGTFRGRRLKRVKQFICLSVQKRLPFSIFFNPFLCLSVCLFLVLSTTLSFSQKHCLQNIPILIYFSLDTSFTWLCFTFNACCCCCCCCVKRHRMTCTIFSFAFPVSYCFFTQGYSSS